MQSATGATEPANAGPAVRPSSSYVLALVVLSCFLWMPRFRGPIDLRYDAGVYYTLGMSLAEGSGYRMLSEPGEIEAIQYPPALPAFVALHGIALGTDDPLTIGAWLRVSYFALFTLYLVAIYWMALRFLSPSLAFLAAALSGLQFHSYYLTNILFAELPFALVTVLFVGLVHPPRRRCALLPAVLLAWTAYLLRSAGMALMIAWVADGLLRRRLRQAGLRVLMCLVPIVCWQVYIGQVKSSDEYDRPAYPYQRADYQNYNVGYVENILLVDSFAPELGRVSAAQFAGRLLANAARVPILIGEAVSADRGFWSRRYGRADGDVRTLPPHAVGTLLVLLLAVTIAWAGVRQARCGTWLVPVYVLGSLGLLCLTPWPGQFLRYASPLTPFLVVLLLQGLDRLGTRLRGSRAPAPWDRRRVLLACCAGMLLWILGYTAKQAYMYNLTTARWHDRDGDEVQARNFYHGKEWRAFDAAIDWLAANAEPNEIVCTSAPHLVHIKTGLKAVQPPYEPDGSLATQLIDAVGASYVIVDKLQSPDVGFRYSQPAIEAAGPEVWEQVYAAPDDLVWIYRRRR